MRAETERQVDEKGRITLPKALRDRLGVEAGDSVVVELEAGQIVVKPDQSVSRAEFIELMRGYITEETRPDDASEINPPELDRDWTGDLPG